MIYVLASTEYRALLTAPGKESDWQVLGSNGQSIFLKNETLFKDIYNKTARKMFEEEMQK